ncbi:AAA family ATPase [Photobacterium swingsii]|uniref:AAA family ATPase n=1 Tax=Photobacterium swingsii TaxID=680026 RepID=UPI00352DB498
MEFSKQLTLNIRAGSPIIQIISHDTLRIRAEVLRAAEVTHRQVFIWDRTNGLRLMQDQEPILSEVTKQPHIVLSWLNGDFEDDDEELPVVENSVVLLEDFHPNLLESEYQLINRLRNFAIAIAGRRVENATIIMSQPTPYLPIELEKDVQVLEMPLPGICELRKLAEQAKQRFNIDERDFNPSNELLNSALGLSTSEAQLAFAKAACEKQRITDAEIPFIVEEKEQVIRKSGHLEYFHPKATLDDIGGLDNLKAWLNRRRKAFSQNAKDFGLEDPRGVLLLGLPGTGKSLAAKAVANAWQLPLLRLDMGKIYGGIVGQSEDNMRQALQLAEALSPSILWVDEIEKGLSGMQSSGSTDGGTTARVLGSFLTWMQEKEKPVFVVATANNISQLPPELLRKGRVDEIFFVDLPTISDREEIIRIHLRSRNRADDFDGQEIAALAKASKGFTGAELEEAIKEAMFVAFDEGMDLTTKYITDAIAATTPLSMTMHELIDDTRKWAKGRAVRASCAEPEKLESTNTDNKPRLKSEFDNPFIGN